MRKAIQPGVHDTCTTGIVKRSAALNEFPDQCMVFYGAQTQSTIPEVMFELIDM